MGKHNEIGKLESLFQDSNTLSKILKIIENNLESAPDLKTADVAAAVFILLCIFSREKVKNLAI